MAEPDGAVHALLLRGWSALVLVAMMFMGSLFLWIGLPLAWLWIASQIQGSTGSLGAGVGAAMFGFILSVVVMVPLLGRLNEVYRRSRIARGLDDTGPLALEAVVAVSALVAIVGFAAWFFLFAGTSPIPINLSY